MRNFTSRPTLSLPFLLLFATATLATGQEAATRISERSREALEKLHENGTVPGASLAFVLPDGAQVTVTAGFADPDTEREMTPKDRLMTGSSGKTFVAAAAMRLVLEGKLSLDEPIAKWVGEREWFQQLPNAGDLTLRHLLNHRSGIPEYYRQYEFLSVLPEDPKRTWKPEELIAFVCDDEPLAPVGEQWSYADTNYLIVGLVLEEVSEQSFYEQVREHFLEPHGLQDTIPSDRCDLPGVAQGEIVMGRLFGFPERAQEDGEFAVNPQFEWCGGGFATTPRDLARWAWLLYSGKAMEGDYLGQLLDGVPTGRFGGERYGLGTFLQNTSAGVMHGHDGFFPGYLTSMGYFPEHGFAVALQINTDDMRALEVPGVHVLLESFAAIAAEELGEGQAPLVDHTRTELLWETAPVFLTPESALYDRERDVLYVTSYDRNYAAKRDPSGFISKLDLLGEVVEREWITGLRAPLGMALHEGRLYVAERGHLTVIDVEAGEVIERHPIPTSVFLNDVACDGEGKVYVSDSFPARPEQPTTIYRLAEGKVEPWLDDPSFGRVNGLYVHGDELLVGNSADGTLRAVELATREARIIASTGDGIVDGIRVTGSGDYLVSHWEGPTFQISPEGELVEILDPSTRGWNVADFEFVVEEGMLIVPTFSGNRVVCYALVD